jgi:hypothetical protein
MNHLTSVDPRQAAMAGLLTVRIVPTIGSALLDWSA